MAEKECIGAELDIAIKIQTDILLSIFSPYPDCKTFDIYASMTPVKEVGGDFEYLHNQHGMMFTALNLATYKEYEVQFNPEDRLFLYTDGISEATNSKEELFGKVRELETLNRYKDQVLSAMLHLIKADIDEFVSQAR